MRKILLAGASLALAAGLAMPGAPARAEIVHTVYGARPVTSFGRRVSAQQHLVLQAGDVVRQMKADSRLAALVRRAKGVFVIPGTGRTLAGAPGTPGVALARHGSWTGPAFFNVSGTGMHGPVVVLLMDEAAVQRFMAPGRIALGPRTRLRVVDAAALDRRQGAIRADAIVWSPRGSDIAGTLGRTVIESSPEDDRAYYNYDVTAREVLADRAPSPNARLLWDQLES